MTMTPAQIARVVHEANRALQIGQADPTIGVSLSWDETDESTRGSAIDGVRGVLKGASARTSHEAWRVSKREQGWVIGPVKDLATKRHPLLLPYDQLSPEARLKDELFVAIVKVLSAQPHLYPARGKTWDDVDLEYRPPE